MRLTRTAVVPVLLILAACSGGSSGSAAQPISASPPSAAGDPPSPSPPVATPPPPGFATGRYGRTVKFQGDLDGRWQLLLKRDGRYQFTSPQTTFDGAYVVTGSRIAFTDAECGVATYTFATAATGLSFVAVGADRCDYRHAFLAGEQWQRAA